MDIRGQTKVREDHIVNGDNGLIPKKKNATPGTVRRLFGKTSQTIPSNVKGIEARD
jgi:hypothetical protein